MQFRGGLSKPRQKTLQNVVSKYVSSSFATYFDRPFCTILSTIAWKALATAAATHAFNNLSDAFASVRLNSAVESYVEGSLNIFCDTFFRCHGQNTFPLPFASPRDSSTACSSDS